MDWLQGEKFIDVADFAYVPRGYGEKYLQHTFGVTALRPVNIVYTHTMYARHLFDLIRWLCGEFIVVTHNCDTNVDDTFFIPDNVKMWFSQNVAQQHPRLQSLPLGLENDRWQKKMNKLEIMKAEMSQEHKKKNLVYMNHNIKTNPAERGRPYELLEGKCWVTAVHGANGGHFQEYLTNLCTHPFIISPMGNGIDTVRTWEALYMGAIPIEKRNINNQFYTDLPICFVDDWEEVTEEFLVNEYKRIKNGTWNMNKLTFTYWKNLIERSVD